MLFEKMSILNISLENHISPQSYGLTNGRTNEVNYRIASLLNKSTIKFIAEKNSKRSKIRMRVVQFSPLMTECVYVCLKT